MSIARAMSKPFFKLDLPRFSGVAKTVHRQAPAPAGLGTPVIGVPEGSPILLDATLISMENGVLRSPACVLT